MNWIKTPVHMKTLLKTEISEVIEGICPSKANSYKVGRSGMYKPKNLTEYENKFYIQCRNRGALIVGYFEIELKVFYPSERADLDNSLKIILDCLQRCQVIKNDNKCVKIIAEKYLDERRPRVEIFIKQI